MLLCWGTSSLPTLFLLGTHGWSLSRFENHKKLKYTGTFLCTQNTLSIEPTGWTHDLWTTRRWRCWLWKWAVHGWTIARGSLPNSTHRRFGGRVGGRWSKELDVDMRFFERDREMLSRGCRGLCYPALWTLLGHSTDSGSDKLYVCFSILFLS